MSFKDIIEGNEIDLSLNELTEVPVKELANIPKATHLDLSYNRIQTLPNDFTSLTHLIKIDLSLNKLSELPQNFGNLINLQHLDLHKNQLRNIPVRFCKLKNLRWLNLKDNPLDPKLKAVAGDCLDEKQCQQCAKKIVLYMQNLESNMEREKQKKLKEKRDPMPKDLLYNPRESDDENEQLKDVSDAENNQVNDIYETSVDTGDNACENISSKPVTQSAMAETNNDDITKTCVECQIKVENFNKDDACEPLVQENLITQEFVELNDESDEDFDDCSSIVSPITPPSKSESDSEYDSDSESENKLESESNSTSHDSSERNSSDDSESDSSSDNHDTSSSTTTASSVDDYVYNYSHTGRQNPSLISESVNEHIHTDFDPVYYNRCSRGCKCACAAPLCFNTHLQNTTRFPHMIRKISGKHNFIHQGTFSSRNDSSCIERMNASPFLPYSYQGDFSSGNKRGGYSVNLPSHSRCYGYKDSRNRGSTMKGRCQSPKHQTSGIIPKTDSHMPNCYLLTSRRCHPNIPGYCGSDEMREMWYRMFYIISGCISRM